MQVVLAHAGGSICDAALGAPALSTDHLFSLFTASFVT